MSAPKLRGGVLSAFDCIAYIKYQSMICAVFDPKVDFHGPPTASLLSFLLSCSYLLSPLHLFMSSNHILGCLPTPRFPSIIPSNMHPRHVPRILKLALQSSSYNTCLLQPVPEPLSFDINLLQLILSILIIPILSSAARAAQHALLWFNLGYK